MHDLTIRIHLGADASEQREKIIGADTLVGDLIIHCKKDYHLPEQDRSGEMIRYALYRDHGPDRELIEKGKSLRMLRIQPFEVLYLADERRPWWQSDSAPRLRLPGSAPPPHRTSDLRAGSTREPPARAERSVICQIELAPGCVRAVAETGLIINRDYLLRELPMAATAREKVLVLLGLPSRLQAVSKTANGHCSIIWKQGWYLYAHQPVYIAGGKHDHGEALLLDQAVTLLLGRDGWPITIRLNSAIIPRPALL